MHCQMNALVCHFADPGTVPVVALKLLRPELIKKSDLNFGLQKFASRDAGHAAAAYIITYGVLLGSVMLRYGIVETLVPVALPKCQLQP